MVLTKNSKIFRTDFKNGFENSFENKRKKTLPSLVFGPKA